ncbi:MAG TPA: hypothetical protein VGS58_22605, partial [Candidatus Sulfopaludibacter sp.]|nr:hypothetical protein [Candidatus Sulfopaludibacter sp.]
EAGYWGPSLPSSIGVADSGTRIRAVLAVPPGVNVYAPVHPIGSQNAQLVSADANGAGGMAMTGSAFGGTYVLLTPSNGAVTATWEVRTADPTSIEQYSFPMLIEGATPGQVASMLQTVTLAPVSGVMSPSSAAPIPRFQGVALPPAP